MVSIRDIFLAGLGILDQKLDYFLIPLQVRALSVTVNIVSTCKRGEALAFTRGIALVRGERSRVVFRSPTRVRNAATLHGVLDWSCTTLVRLPFALAQGDCCFFSLTFACSPSYFSQVVSNRICRVSHRISMKPRARRHQERQFRADMTE